MTERPPRSKGQMEEQWKIPLSPLSPVARMTISMSAARSAAQARDRRSLTGSRRPHSPAPALGGCEWMRPPDTCERDRGSHPRNARPGGIRPGRPRRTRSESMATPRWDGWSRNCHMSLGAILTLAMPASKAWHEPERPSSVRTRQAEYGP